MARSTSKLKFIVPLALVLVPASVVLATLWWPFGVHTQDPQQALIQAGADLNKAGKNDYTALMVAANQGHTEIARLLRAAGARQ